ncbi:prepilin peptidase [Desulfosarcina sp. OttesenSCG-928-A07]|nr:prepilin peptidase [Desulfosarcina sp. OttesenSCG-928-G17]MDL2328718.1 prepilin peptidase [Desulfosarcina sp. OttesenSCG-928-A07]
MTLFFAFCIAAFVLGACIGSFLNVCIYRIPAGLSIVHPGSRCPGCGEAIFWYDNIPLVSYLVLLRGKCRFCKMSVSIRYLFVELVTGFFAVACLYAFGLTFYSLVNFLFMATLIVVSFIDLDHLIIPDRISLPGIFVFFLAAFSASSPSWQDRAIGIVAGAGSIWLISAGYRQVTGKDGMGGGDAKLLAMVGALIGWQGVLFTLFSASAIGTLVGMPALIKSGKGLTAQIPFGPFLSAGAILYLFFGEALIHWYLHLWLP